MSTTSTKVTYTPVLAFSEPWFLAPSQISSVTFELDASVANGEIRAPIADSIEIRLPDGMTTHFKLGPTAQDFSSSSSSLSGVPTASGEQTTSSPASASGSALLTGTPSGITPGPSTWLSSNVTQPPAIQSTSTPAAPMKNSHTLSVAQTVGLAIGCVAVGILIAALAACILARRRRSRTALHSARSRSKASTLDTPVDKRPSSAVLNHIERPAPSSSLDALLARPLPEEELVTMLTRLRGLISDCADDCVRNQHMSLVRRPDPAFIKRLDNMLGPQSVMTAQKLATMSLDHRDQANALRYLFAWTILSNIRSTGAPETTLLPPEISECMSSMAGLSSDTKGLWYCIDSMHIEQQLTISIQHELSYSQSGDKSFAS